MEKIFQIYLLKIELKLGISFVPQTRNVFADLTVRENLEVGAVFYDKMILIKLLKKFMNYFLF